MNKLYPGLPDYTGPTTGWFTLLHHQGPHFEYSDDVSERIDYIRECKSSSEVPIRLRHIVFVSADKPAAWAEFGPRLSRHALILGQRDGSGAGRVLDAELARLIPDCRWNGKEIEFEL